MAVMSQGDKRQISSLTDKIKDIQLKYQQHFKHNTGLTYDYILELAEIYSKAILTIIQQRSQPLEKAEFKDLFCLLLKCSSQGKGSEKAKNEFMKSSKQLVQHILANISD